MSPSRPSPLAASAARATPSPSLCRAALRAGLVALALGTAGCPDDPEDDAGMVGSTSGSTGADSTTGGGPSDDSSAGSTSAGTDTDADPTTGGPGTDPPGLGQTPNVLCEASVAQLQIIIDQNASGSPDLAAITEAYLGPEGDGTALQQMVQTFGGELGRVEDGVLVDDAAILDALALGTDEALVDVEMQVYLLITKLVRARIASVADALPDADRDPALLYAAWDDAYCYYDAVLRAHAEAADALAREIEPIAAGIEDGFETGHGGIESAEASFAIDEWVVPPAKQVIEKSLFRIYDRLILDLAAAASTGADPVLARRAYGLFQIVEDRLMGRNTPGIDIIEADLTGNPMLIDPAVIRHELDIAWAKRVRRYSSHAIDDGTVGTAEGHTGGNEGRTYAKVVLPSLEQSLDGFDGAAYLAQWDAWIEAIEADDYDAAVAASEALVEPICEYQAMLGIAECTGSADEPAP